MGIGIVLLIVTLVIIFLSGFRVIRQYEEAVLFTFGKFQKMLGPGLKWIIPIVQTIRTVDTRQRTQNLKSQEVMSKDQVNLGVDGVVFFYVDDVKSAVLNVEDIEEQLSWKATSELKEVIGNKTMTEALKQRENIAQELKSKLNEAIEDKGDNEKEKKWGLVIKAVQVNNIELPKQLIRAMAKEAEAEREKIAIKTRAEGEYDASQKYKQASNNYKDNTAMRLRELKTYEEIGKENNSFMVVIPSDMQNSMGTVSLAKGLESSQKNLQKGNNNLNKQNGKEKTN